MTEKELERKIQSLLTCPCKVRVVAETQSTNTDLKALADRGAEEGTVIIARRQSGGRGRMGRTFYSPEDTGLYLSLLLRPKSPPEEAVFLTVAAAVAAARAVKKTLDREVSIKWVNDLYLDGKKVCGILTEAAAGPSLNQLSYAVCGIGFNLFSPKGGFPEEIASVAGALCDTVDPTAFPRLAAAFLNELYALPSLSRTQVLEEYRARSLLTGKRVSSPTGAFEGSALVLGIDDSAGLRLRMDDGRETVLSWGEVSVRLDR